ncbi:MAG: hypothetical protein WAM14_13730 [Candidatus Nitrosopolaris sp.]
MQFEQFDRRGSQSQNNDDGTSNGLNCTNGISHNSADPVVQNTASSDVSNETVDDDTANPILPPYVYRIGHSDKFGCKISLTNGA